MPKNSEQSLPDMAVFDQIELDTLRERVTQLEEAILSLSADLQNINLINKDMQKVLVRIATNQQQLAERVKMWPYVKIDPHMPNQRRKKSADDE